MFKIRIKGIHNILAILFVTLTFSIPRSHASLKLIVIIIMLLFSFYRFILEKKIKIHLDIFIFYFIISLVGIIWAIVGYLHGGDIVGINDGIRLWFFWSIAYTIICVILINVDLIKVINYSILLSAWLIFIINLFGFINAYYNLNIIDYDLIKKMELFVGIHKGYTQIMSHNIGSLFFVTPYLISLFLHKENNYCSKKFLFISLVLTLLNVIFSGRRALWLVIFITPILIYMFSLVTNRTSLLKRYYKQILFISLFVTPILLIVFYNSTLDYGFFNFLKSAFVSNDPRSIQKIYLVNGFFENIFFGSGFGVGAGYVRNIERPWIYELTYFQLLYNFGLIGCTIIIALIGTYLYKIFILIQRDKNGSNYAFSLLIGFFSFSIGAYSNPYFGSFDFLIVISIIPLLSSYLSLSKIIE